MRNNGEGKKVVGPSKSYEHFSEVKVNTINLQYLVTQHVSYA